MPPEFLQPAKDENLERYAMYNYKTFSLTCRVVGFPPPQIELIYMRNPQLNFNAKTGKYSLLSDRVVQGAAPYGLTHVSEAVFRWNISRFQGRWTCNNVETFSWPDMA